MKKAIKITIAIILLGMFLISMVSMASALTITSVSTNPNEIAPGETSVINIELENDWDEDITDVSISLNLANVPFAPFDSSSEDSFDEIEDDDDKTAHFKVIALNDAESGIYKIPVEISFYDEDDEKHEKNSLISLTINSDPIIGASIENGLLLKPRKNEINIKIVNKGLSDVKFLEVELGSSTYYNVLSTKNVYIGDVDSDDFDNVEFKVYFKGNAPNIVNLPVTITYKDVLNKEYTEDFSLQVNVYTNDKAIELGLLEKNKTPMYVGIVVGVLIIWFGYKKLKKRRKLKKAKAEASA